MSSKSKKSKHHKSKISDDLSQIKYEKAINSSNENEHDKDLLENYHQRASSVTRRRKRNHTKISHNKENNLSNIIIETKNDKETKNEKGKKVKFSNIDIIDVESWKKLNLKMTAEENTAELIKITEGRRQRKKNVTCCIII